MLVYGPAQCPVVAGDARRYTNMNETRNETDQSPGHRGQSQAQRPDLHFLGGSGPWSVRHRPRERVVPYVGVACAPAATTRDLTVCCSVEHNPNCCGILSVFRGFAGCSRADRNRLLSAHAFPSLRARGTLKVDRTDYRRYE